MALLEKSCEAKNATACYYLSGLHIAGAKNGRKVGDLIEKDQYDVPKDMEKAFKYAMKGCNLGNMYSCANLSQMYHKGEGVEKNQELADKFKARAVELQEDATNTSQTLKFGLGIES